jgi:hypothetical protein
MKFGTGKIQLGFLDILQRVSPEAILAYYTNITKVPCVIKSILRVDKNPSLGLYYSTTGIAYIDYATNDRGSLTALLMKYMQLTFEELKARIVKDMDKIKDLDRFIIPNESMHRYSNKEKTYVNTTNKRLDTHKNIEVATRPFNEDDLTYWKNQGVEEKWLKFGEVYPISDICVGRNWFKAEKYAYVYVEYKDNLVSKKVYQPFSKRLKWICNHDSSVWDLWQQVMKSNSDKLIITKSRKDALCIWSNTKIPCTSLQAEGFLPKEHVLNQLKEKFKKIWILYDNDYDKVKNYGREYGSKISKLYNIPQIEIPNEYQSKDASSLYFNMGKVNFIKVINNMIGVGE